MKKHIDFFDPTKVTVPVHIIGCGALGSTVAVLLARCSIQEIHLWDFDKVETHNIANQQFFVGNIGQLKTDALGAQLKAIHPRIKVIKHGGWEDDVIRGHVFLCLDNIDTRRSIVEYHMTKQTIDSMIDLRMSLKFGQTFGAVWHKVKDREILLKSMNFSHEEAVANQPVSACNMALSIMPTVQVTCSIAVANWINYINGSELNRYIMADTFRMMIDS